MVVVYYSTSLVLDSFNKYGLYVALSRTWDQTQWRISYTVWLTSSSRRAKRVSGTASFNKKWIKTLWLLLWDVNDNQVNTKRIKLIGTTYHSSLFNLWKSLLLFVFVGDLLMSVSPKHPTGSKTKTKFFDCSSNISASNVLPLSLQASICSLQELKESLQLDSLTSLADTFKIEDHG